MSPKRLVLARIREISPGAPTARVRKVCWDFGLPPREPPLTVAERLELSLAPGRLILLLGPSGAGKSSLLAAIAQRCPDPVWVRHALTASRRAVVDAIAPRNPLPRALDILTACGLGEPRLWIRRFHDLSDGERFRAALARAVGRSLDRADRPPIFCDEFTAILHRRLARAVAYNLRKLVTRTGLTLVAASTHEDILRDLQPDLVVHLDGREPRVVEHTPRSRAISLHRRACVEVGAVRDYALFAPMHYRHRDGLGFVDSVYLLRERSGGPPLGICVFAMAPIELALRNRATANRFCRNPHRLNRELRILRRLVMHPDIRGCGLGHWFVRQTLPLVGTRFVECLAAMGAVNPVFERAGMTCIGRVSLPRGRLALLARLKNWGIDPFLPNFPERLRRFPRVRRLVVQTILDWMRATNGSGRYNVDDRSPRELAVTFRQLVGEPPMYYLWDREREFPRRDPNPGAARRVPRPLRGRGGGPPEPGDAPSRLHRPSQPGEDRRHDPGRPPAKLRRNPHDHP